MSRQKRFKSVVMDGKVIGSLREFPVKDRDVHEIIGAKGLTSKLLNNRVTRNALKFVMQRMRTSIRAVEYGRVTEVIVDLSYKIGSVHFRLGCLLDMKGVTKKNYEEIYGDHSMVF